MTIRLLLAQKKEIHEALALGSANTNKGRYVRLMWLAAVAVVVHLPLGSWVIITNATVYPVYPWISWEDTHFNYKRISYFTRFMTSQDTMQFASLSIAFWAIVLCGVNFFLFFGLGEEALKQYDSVLGAILRPFGIKYPKEKRRRTVKKTWIDILLSRSGRPVNPSSSFTRTTTHEHNTLSNSAIQSKRNPQSRALPIQVQNISGGNDLTLDISDLDFLDPIEAKKQARIAAYTRPGRAARKARALDRRPGSTSSSSDLGNFNENGGEVAIGDITNSNNHQDCEPQNVEKIADVVGTVTIDDQDQSKDPHPEPEPPNPEVQGIHLDGTPEIDLEAQELEEEELVAQRRRTFLEENPSLIEEVTW
jgi:hypothetical protein